MKRTFKTSGLNLNGDMNELIGGKTVEVKQSVFYPDCWTLLEPIIYRGDPYTEFNKEHFKPRRFSITVNTRKAY